MSFYMNSEMFMIACSPDIAEKTRPPQGPAAGLPCQERYGQYCAVPARRSRIAGIWQVPAGNGPAFAAPARLGTHHGGQISLASDFALLLFTVRPRCAGP
jgi:hypothetical protein